MTKHLPRWRIFDSRENLYSTLSQDIADALQTASVSRPQVLFGVSGGSTPIPVYQALAQCKLPWNKIKMLLVDERWVPTNHADSNERNIRQAFSSNPAAEKTLVGLWSDQPDLNAGAQAADQKLALINAEIDVVLLGMGEDGHFASLFPTSLQFKAAMSDTGKHFVFPISPMPEHAAHSRLSMSLAYIQASRQIILAITGENKRRVLEQAMLEGNIEQLPIAGLFKENSPAVEVYWSN